MKVFTMYLGVLLFFIACSDQNKESKISVFANFNFDSLEIVENKFDFVFYQGKVLKKFAVQGNQTSFVLALNKQKKLTLSLPEIYKTDFFVEPGDSICIKIEKLENGRFITQYTGSNSRINQYYSDNILMYKIDRELSNKVNSLNYYDLDEFCNSNFHKQIEFLKIDKKDETKNTYITSYLETLYISTKIFKIINYPTDSLKSFQNIVDSLIDRINNKGKYFSRFRASLNMINSFFKFYEDINGSTDKESVQNKIKIINQYFRNDMIDIAYLKLIQDELYLRYSPKQKEKVEYLLEKFKNSYNNKEIFNFVMSEYRRIVSLNSAEQIYPLEFLDISNQKSVLNEATQSGTYYIFFWGSWCAYCHDHIATYNSLFDNLSIKGIKFINIAFENSDDYKTWKLLLDKNGLKGESFFLHYTPLTDAFEKYNITGLPRFLIVKDARIIDAYASPPNDPELETILLNISNEKY